jgi:tetratricopeptide (TPR) repeat protein
MLQQRNASAVVGALLIGMVAWPAAAQQSPQQCRLSYRSNFRLNGAQQYLTRVQTTSFEDDKRRYINDAHRVLSEAAAQDRNADPLTLWFFFGQVHAYRRDLVGADSAFRRAEAVADADCRREIGRRRRNEYVPLQNAAVEMIQAGNQDSALALFRQGLVIYRDDPGAYINMAGIFSQRNANDSAVHYYRLAARTGDDPRHNDLRKTALINAARTLHRVQRYPDAEGIYREYVGRYPNDMEARTNLAGVLTAQGKHGEAAEIYNQLLANADSIDSFALFETGVALFRQAQQDSTQRQRKYELAAQAFEAGLRKNPYYRDAIYNLANTYVAANDTARALPAARRLVAVDPMNRSALRLLAAGYQRALVGARVQDSLLRSRRDTTANRFRRIAMAYQDSTVRALQHHDSLAWEFSVLRFDARDSTASIRGAIQNLQDREQGGFRLTIEFVNAAGEALAREVVEVPNLSAQGQPGSAYDFNLSVSAAGILAYRYRAG